MRLRAGVYSRSQIAEGPQIAYATVDDGEAETQIEAHDSDTSDDVRSEHSTPSNGSADLVKSHRSIGSSIFNAAPSTPAGELWGKDEVPFDLLNDEITTNQHVAGASAAPFKPHSNT